MFDIGSIIIRNTLLVESSGYIILRPLEVTDAVKGGCSNTIAVIKPLKRVLSHDQAFCTISPLIRRPKKYQLTLLQRFRLLQRSLGINEWKAGF